MDAMALRRGDKFVEVGPDAFDKMSPREQKALKRLTVEADPTWCDPYGKRVHVRSDRGHLCFEHNAPVTAL